MTTFILTIVSKTFHVFLKRTFEDSFFEYYLRKNLLEDVGRHLRRQSKLGSSMLDIRIYSVARVH